MKKYVHVSYQCQHGDYKAPLNICENKINTTLNAKLANYNQFLKRLSIACKNVRKKVRLASYNLHKATKFIKIKVSGQSIIDAK